MIPLGQRSPGDDQPRRDTSFLVQPAGMRVGRSGSSRIDSHSVEPRALRTSSAPGGGPAQTRRPLASLELRVTAGRSTTVETIGNLVQRFSGQRQAYADSAYKEAQVRREFIDPFFEILGWDMQNRAGAPEAYKDVIHEDAIKFAGGTKAPDYCFRVGGARSFFVEAKKPATNIQEGVSAAFQLRRYAWTANLPISILTDFEELAVYDARYEPDSEDSAATARLFYLTYDQYEQHWDQLAGLFSRDSLLVGSLDQFASQKGKRHGSARVDTVFLGELNHGERDWRLRF